MIRIQKIIADNGYCSRRNAETLIQAGQVKVNGRIANIGDKANPRDDIITVNGVEINGRAVKPRYIKLYKPRGYLCSMSDPHGKKLITELLTKIPERVYPIGRLDANSEGLLLLTNDGDFANKIAHPSNKIKKTYRVTIAGKVDEMTVAALSAGVKIEINGKSERTLPCTVEIAVAEPNRTVLLITISEGKNRQIRRMCEALGLTVSRLKRVSVGGIKLGLLKPGEFADLTDKELRNITSR